MFSCYLEVEKHVPRYFEPENTVAAIYLEREKSGSLLFGDQKMLFTMVRSKKKDYDIYLKKKTWFTAIRSTKKMFPSFGIGKNWFLAISSQKNTVAAIWREKKVDPCYLETKKCSSLLLYRSKEKDYDMYLKSEKLVHSN